MGLRPVKSYKHVVDASGTISDTNSTVDLIIALDNPVLSNVNGVQTASTVSAIFLNVQVGTRVPFGGTPRVYFIVFKNPGANLIVPDPTATGANDNKKFVIHQEMMMVNNFPVGGASIFPRTMFKGVIRIPRSYKRQGVNDRLQLILKTPDVTGLADWCIQCIYKEFR